MEDTHIVINSSAFKLGLTFREAVLFSYLKNYCANGNVYFDEITRIFGLNRIQINGILKTLSTKKMIKFNEKHNGAK